MPDGVNEYETPKGAGNAANITATIALFVSIATAAFSIYQRYFSQREARINAAIEISKSFYAKSFDKKLAVALESLFSKGPKLSIEQETLIFTFANDLEYIAFLSNTERIDEGYLSNTLKCAIYVANKSMKKEDP
jgi:hypothetical protein